MHVTDTNQEVQDSALDGAADAQLDSPTPDGQTARLAELEAERDALREQLLRLMAEFQNFRKRSQQEREELRKRATESLVVKLLPILDSFERTIISAEQGSSPESLVDGVRAVDRQLRSVLESIRLSRIPAVGQQFDPEHHEAIAAEHSEEHEEGTIVQEIEPGYKLAEHVLRPARVRVSKKL